MLDVITSIAAFVVFLISISDAGVSEPIPSLLSTTSAVTVADEPTIFPTVIAGVPSSPNEVDAKPAVCATPLRYPVNVDPVNDDPVQTPVIDILENELPAETIKLCPVEFAPES